MTMTSKHILWTSALLDVCPADACVLICCAGHSLLHAHIPQVPGRGLPRSRRVSSAVRKRSSMPRAIQTGSHEGHKHIQGLPWIPGCLYIEKQWHELGDFTMGMLTWNSHKENIDSDSIYTYYYVSWAFQRCVFGHCFSLWSARYIYIYYIYIYLKTSLYLLINMYFIICYI